MIRSDDEEKKKEVDPARVDEVPLDVLLRSVPTSSMEVECGLKVT